MTRIFLGGKAVVTVREHSILHITEVPGTSLVNLAKGRISVAVAKDKMKRGETVEIRTPNAIAAIRGTVVVAEVESGSSTITVLRGLIDVTRLDGATGRSLGPAVPVGALESVTVNGGAPVPPATAIKPETAQKLTSDFKVIPKTAPRASVLPVIEAQVEQAKHETAAVVLTGVGEGGKIKGRDGRLVAAAKGKRDGSSDGGDGDVDSAGGNSTGNSKGSSSAGGTATAAAGTSSEGSTSTASAASPGGGAATTPAANVSSSGGSSSSSNGAATSSSSVGAASVAKVTAVSKESHRLRARRD